MYTYQLFNPTLGLLTLDRDPLGWQGMKRKLVRDATYHGVQLQVTFDLTWTGPARQFINQVWEAEGIEGVILLTIYRFDPNQLRDFPRYFGRLNLAKWSEKSPTLNVPLRAVQTNAEETGFQKAFLNADDTVSNLLATTSLNGQPLTPPTPADVLLTSRVLEKSSEGQFTTPIPVVFSPGHLTSALTNRDQYIVVGLDNFIRDDLGAQRLFTGFQSSFPPFTLEVTEDGEYTIDVKLAVEQFGIALFDGDYDAATFQLGIRINSEDFLLFNETWTGITGWDFRQSNLVGSLYLERRLTAGDQLFLYGRLVAFDVSGPYDLEYTVKWREDTYLRVTAGTEYDPTLCRGLLAYEALERAVAVLTGQEDALRSTFFGRIDSAPTAYDRDGAGAYNFLTTGFQLRRFPLAEKPLTTSFKALFDALACLYPLGVGIEYRDGRQVVVVETLDYFYPATVAVRLASVTSVDYEVATDRYYNTAVFGNQKWRITDVGGLDEINGRRDYALPITQLKATYDALNTFSTAGAYIEATRRQQYVDGATKDQAADDDWFIIALTRQPGGWAVETDDAVVTSSGIPAIDTAYNLRHSPARLARRCGAALAAAVQHRPDPVLRLTKAEANRAAIVQLTGEAAPIDEGADIVRADLPAPLWQNRRAKVTATLTRAQADALVDTPYGRVTFPDPDTGTVKSGFVLDAEIDEDSGAATLTLLLAS